MALDKGLLALAGVVFVGLVGYKILKKKSPDLARKASGIREKASEIAEGVRESFQEGYAHGSLQ